MELHGSVPAIEVAPGRTTTSTTVAFKTKENDSDQVLVLADMLRDISTMGFPT